MPSTILGARALLCMSLLLLPACGGLPSNPGSEQMSPSAGKADGGPEGLSCADLGAPESCDVCRVAGLYDDDDCHASCDFRDAACDAPFALDTAALECGAFEDAFHACTADGTNASSCVPAPSDGLRYEAARMCCDFHRDFCDALEAPQPGFEPVVSWISTPFRFRQLGAGATGRHRAGVYRVGDFAAATFADAMRDFDRDVRGCTDRGYSNSRADGIALYEAFVADRAPFEGASSFVVGRLLDFVRDDARTRAVFASVPDGGDDPSCDYADYYVFRRDGTALHLGFDDRPEHADLASALGPEGIRYVDDADFDTLDRMQEYGHNGGSSIGIWSEAALDYHQLSDHVRAYAAAQDGCIDRGLSRDADEAHERFSAHVRTHFHMSDIFGDEDDVELEFPGFLDDRDLIASFVQDPANLSLLSSEFSDELPDFSESCLIYDFFVLRDNGTAIRFTVNQTD